MTSDTHTIDPAWQMPSPARIQELLFDAARIGRTDMIAGLIEAGGDIAATDTKGHTPLILATYHDQENASRALLALGAAVDQGDAGRGNTPLMGVAFKGYAGIARLLLSQGADPHAVNQAGQTALMFAALFSHTEIVDMLLAAGADPDAVDAAGNTAVSVAHDQGNAAMVARLRAKPA